MGRQRLWNRLRVFPLFPLRDTTKPAKLAKEVTTVLVWHVTHVELLVRKLHVTVVGITKNDFSTRGVRPPKWIPPWLRYRTSQRVPSRSV